MKKHLRLHDSKSLELFENQVEEIESELKTESNEKRLPTLEQRLEYNKIVFDYCKQYGRKIYGGFAANSLVKAKNPKDSFYPEGDPADIDFYSPEPINDAMRLANIFTEKGYKYISASEAQHSETYTVFVDFVNVADISYVPRNIYHRMPFVTIDGINYTGPHFIMIDMLRMFNDPLMSGELRWKKTFPRFITLQKYYPFKKIDKNIVQPKVDIGTTMLNRILDELFKFIKGNNTMVLFGDYAYNYFLSESGYKSPLLKITRYEVVSTNYTIDGRDIYDLLKKKFPDEVDNFRLTESYPLWQFLDYSTVITYKDHPIFTIIGNNKKCVPILNIKAKQFKDGKMVEETGKINMATYSLNLMLILILRFKARVNKQSEIYMYYSTMVSHLIMMRNNFLKVRNKNIFDKTIFREFQTKCIGKAEDPVRDTRIERDDKAKSGKMIVWKYYPSRGIKEPITDYKFANTSGNPIRKTKNLRLQQLPS